MVLSSLTDTEAKTLLERLSLEYEKVKDYYIAVIQIKNLIYFVEPHQITPDTSYNEKIGGQVEYQKVEKVGKAQ